MEVRAADRALGELLIEKGLLHREQLDDCFREQSEARKRGGITFLGHIVLTRGWVTLDQLGELLVVQRDRGLSIKEDPLDPVDAAILSGAFGRFTILQRIGLGGMAAVYLAFDEILKRLVALKILTSNLSPDGTVVDRFMKEAQTLARLSHPNLIRIYDTGAIGGLQYISMEYVQGRNLEELIDRRELPIERVAPIVRDLCACIRYAHERGVIHRDLKPSNIMIEERTRRVVVMDFGIARSMDERTRMTMTGSILGTPGYMSPEQARGASVDVDAQTDVYGAGAILFECLVGRPPFGGNSEQEVLNSILSEEPVRFPAEAAGVPEALRRICLKAMDKDKRGRYGSMTGIQEDLDRFLQGKPVLARPARRATIFLRRLRRHKARAALIALFVAGAAAAAAYFGVTRVQRLERLEELARRGDDALAAGDFEGADRAYDLAFSEDPDNRSLKERRDACRLKISARVGEARRAATDEEARRRRVAAAQLVFVETQEKVTGARKHLYREGEGVADIRRDLEGVLARLDGALNDAPLADGYYLKGRVYHLLGDAVTAQACYDRALEIQPGHNLTRIYLGRLLIERSIVEPTYVRDQKRQRRRMEELMKEAVQQLEGVDTGAAFEKKDLMLAKGYALIARSRHHEAYRFAREAADELGDEEFHFLAGVASMRLPRLGDAVSSLTRAIQGRANYFEAYFLRGMAYQLAGKPAEMEADYRTCVRIHPGFAAAWNNLGSLYQSNQRTDLASDCYAKAIAADPNLANPYVNLGVILQLQGRLREASALYDRALKIDPLHDEAYFSRGVVGAALGDAPGAMAAYTACLEVNPAHGNCWMSRGNLFFSERKLEEAIRDYTRALAIADSWMAFYNRGYARALLADWENALADLDRSIRRNKRHAPSFSARGSVNLKLKRYDEAVLDLEEAKRLDPALEPEIRDDLKEALRRRDEH